MNGYDTEDPRVQQLYEEWEAQLPVMSSEEYDRLRREAIRRDAFSHAAEEEAMGGCGLILAIIGLIVFMAILTV